MNIEEQPQTQKQPQKHRKILFVGDGGTGKTTFLKKMFGEGFEKKYIPTIGIDPSSCVCNGIQNDIWDTAGQERYGGMAKVSFMRADLAFVFCSMESPISVKNVESWIENVSTKNENIEIIIVCNKMDLEKKKCKKSARKIADKYKLQIFETSVKSMSIEELDIFNYMS